jgi:hypothetical protein
LLPLGISLQFAAPSYKALLAVATLSALAYGLALWVFEFSPSEARVLRSAIFPQWRTRKAATSLE